MVAMAWRRKNSSGDESSPWRGATGADEEEKVPRGHVPMVADGDERVMVPVRLLGDPRIADLLKMAAQQYGYRQPGVLRVPCDAARFRRTVDGAMLRCGISSPA